MPNVVKKEQYTICDSKGTTILAVFGGMFSMYDAMAGTTRCTTSDVKRAKELIEALQLYVATEEPKQQPVDEDVPF